MINKRENKNLENPHFPQNLTFLITYFTRFDVTKNVTFFIVLRIIIILIVVVLMK